MLRGASVRRRHPFKETDSSLTTSRPESRLTRIYTNLTITFFTIFTFKYFIL